MAKLSTDELLDAFKEMTLLELSEFVKQFEDVFDVKAAAPVAFAGPAGPFIDSHGEDCLTVNKEPSGHHLAGVLEYVHSYPNSFFTSCLMNGTSTRCLRFSTTFSSGYRSWTRSRSWRSDSQSSSWR